MRIFINKMTANFKIGRLQFGQRRLINVSAIIFMRLNNFLDFKKLIHKFAIQIKNHASQSEQDFVTSN